ncbi:WD40 repeat-like protein [Patellaria atrata CBS 101060]|uniref:WD40 repeat-like protein n=1 Tax=Patellaria atrata CBS 101060 TaxID=1346257 RepID=A0A9P4SD02_9PEZI|nr:WD40 repeat-like protein [Patellaria atrata CBS 101060]
MSRVLKQDWLLAPITALEHYELGGEEYLLAGVGPFIRCIHKDSASLVWTHQVFKDQAIHGIVAHSREGIAIIWGAELVRLVTLGASNNVHSIRSVSLCLGPLIRVGDWVLDIEFSSPSEDRSCIQTLKAALITAHNALFEVTVHKTPQGEYNPQLLELTASARCILYAAHVTWLSPCRILVAAGTAFGEIIVWSSIIATSGLSITQVHHTFTGHEGSIFGLKISPSLVSFKGTRILASCSDDRTIRIWDLKDVTTDSPSLIPLEVDYSLHQQTTPVNTVEEVDIPTSSSKPIALSWGHVSRIWNVQFILSEDIHLAMLNSIHLLSVGEDASAQLWHLQTAPKIVNDALTLNNIRTFPAHVGKNIWSSSISKSPPCTRHAVTGGADGSIVCVHLQKILNSPSRQRELTIKEVFEAVKSEQIKPNPGLISEPAATTGLEHLQISGTFLADSAVGVKDLFRSYSFVSANSFITTTNSGAVLLASKHPDNAFGEELEWRVIVQTDEIKGYSVSVGLPSQRVAFFAGTTGIVYVYDHTRDFCDQLCCMGGKVTGLFATEIVTRDSQNLVDILVTYIGSQTAHLLSIDLSNHMKILQNVDIQLPPSFIVTSMLRVINHRDESKLYLGSRSGSLAVSPIPTPNGAGRSTRKGFSANEIIKGLHGKEAVTSLTLVPPDRNSQTNHAWILSTGRDGNYAVMDLDHVEEIRPILVHQSSLPFGPNIEGAFMQDHLFIYGFHSKRFILWDETIRQEICSINCGGAHRKWAFLPFKNIGQNVGGCTLIWTKASTCKIQADGSIQQLLTEGGHGREIKSAATANTSEGQQLIATGSEDTDIRIWDYVNTDSEIPRFRCLKVLKRHNTGLQHLQWSFDGRFLFSSGGTEEFFVWKVRQVPQLGIGVVCESQCVPYSDAIDLRIMSFYAKEKQSSNNVTLKGDSDSFIIFMVYSDSTIRVYDYMSTPTDKTWNLLLSTNYMTCCLTQAFLFTPIAEWSIFTAAATDGNLVFWKFPSLIVEGGKASASVSRIPIAMDIFFYRKIHQNSIKTLCHHSPNASITVVLTGGDDNAIGISIVRWDHFIMDKDQGLHTILIPRAHAAAVNASLIIPIELDNKLQTYHYRGITSSNDQRLKSWDILVDLSRTGADCIDIMNHTEEFTSIADVSSMDIITETVDSSEVTFVVCGVGMETWKTAL